MRNGLAKVAILSLLLVGVSQGKFTVAQQGPQNAELGRRARDLNNELLGAYARLGNLRPLDTPAAIRSQAESIIGQRAAVLEALVEDNPKEALSLAFSADLLANLAAAFPNAANNLESTGEWEGPLEVTVEDGLDLQSHKMIYRMSIRGAQPLNLHFSDDTEALQSGDVLRVRGMRIRSEVAAADGGTITGTTFAGAATCSPLGAQKSIVLLVTMPGTPPPAITADSVRDIFFASVGRSVSEYWRENSYGQAWAEGDVRGWYQLDANYNCDQFPNIRDAAIRAADRDVDFSQYRRVFLVISGMSGNCGWAGLSNVGCGSTLNTAEGTFTVSTAWMLSGYFSNRNDGVMLSAHEGGHGLGLAHASSRDFGNEALGAPGVAGTLSEYGDYFSSMGFWNFGHYAAPHKVRLGWMTNYLTVSGNGSFSLQPMESGGNVHALKIQRGTDPAKAVWLEYRQGTGIFDSTLSTQPFAGALVHYQDSTTGTNTHLLDFTPGTTSYLDPALVGAWNDPYTNLSINVTNATPASLNVNVNYGSVPCVTSTPTVALSPLNPSAYESSNVNYTVTITNNDTSTCSPRSFSMTSLVPGAWPTTFAQNAVTVAPASKGSTGMMKSVPAGTAPSTYSVDAVAASSGNSFEGVANLTVMPLPPPPPPPPPSAPLSITLTAPPTAVRNTVAISALVTQGTAGAAGATVTFTMVTPTGNVAKKATTDSTGAAVWNFKTNPKAAKGTYTVTAQAILGSQAATSAPVTFTVQ